MKTQQEVNNFFQENTVNVSAIYQIVQYLKDFNLKLPNNVILHEKGIGQAYFFKWFDNGPFKPGDVLVSQAGNLVLFSHLLFASLLFTAICKASLDSHFAFLHFFSMGMVLIPVDGAAVDYTDVRLFAAPCSSYACLLQRAFDG